jgi:hypothetical protein
VLRETEAGYPPAAEHRAAQRTKVAQRAGAAFQRSHAATKVAVDLVAEGLELGRQAGKVVHQHAAQAVERIVDSHVDTGAGLGA